MKYSIMIKSALDVIFDDDSIRRIREQTTSSNLTFDYQGRYTRCYIALLVAIIL